MSKPGVESDFQYYELMLNVLRDIFGEFDQAKLSWLLPRLNHVELHAGDLLMEEGSASDAMYIVLSGRLRASIRDKLDQEIVLGELSRGDPVGEMGVISGAPRRATVRAIRDCVLVRLAALDFAEVLHTWPNVALPLARKLIERQARSNAPRSVQKKIVNLCVLPLHQFAQADLIDATCQRMRDEVEAVVRHARGNHTASVALHRQASLPPEFSSNQFEANDEAARKLTMWLDQQESRHEIQIFQADAEDTAWTRLCLRHADQILLLADADHERALSLVERQHLTQAPLLSEATQSMLLLHPATRQMPSRTREWLERRPNLCSSGHSHYHLRIGHLGDWQRLARILSNCAVGLVLAGGGARGFCQLGVLQALEEQGVQWDFAGGTSIGSIMAAYAAMDLPLKLVQELAHVAFSRNPTGDFNLLPLMSVMRGRRLKHVIEDAVVAATGQQIDIEDLWKPFYCVASNYLRAREEVLRRGPLARLLSASVSIPAALPPVLWQGDLLTDGGSFNNYPVDVMRASGAARVIGVDMGSGKYRPLNMEELPTPFELFVDRFLRPRRKRKYRGIPSLPVIIFNVAAIASAARANEMRSQVDLSFTPDVARVGLLNWKAFYQVRDIGLDHARDKLAQAETQPLLAELQALSLLAIPEHAQQQRKCA